MSETPFFWNKKPLSELDAQEWESLCDGCGRCCLIKVEEEDSGQFHYTDVVCRLFDRESCRCGDYARRDVIVPDCLRLTPENVGELRWMPPSCAYRLLAEGEDLPPWHPLISGDPATVAPASVRGRIHALEDEVTLPQLVRRIRVWPGRWPSRCGGRKGKKTARSGV